MKVFMFAGQGAQRIGMGAGLFEAFPQQVAQADEILGYSIADLCLNGPPDRLTQTQFTQPALFVVGALDYLRRAAEGVRPDYVLGHSVAEFTALFAAGVVDFATGLRLIHKRGALMAQAGGGGMAAVLGLDADQVRAVLDGNGLSTIHPANFNTPKQIVVSGDRAAIVAAEPLFLAAGASYYRVLQVSGAFHTPFMAPAQVEFAAFLADCDLRPARVPVISNVTARPHVHDRLRARLAEQITAPVRWAESLRYLLAKGVAPEDCEELGATGMAVLKPMVKHTQIEAGPLDAADLAREEVASEPVASPAPVPRGGFSAERLGAASFRAAYGLRHAYGAGAMYQGIASADLVVRLAQAGLLGFFGAGGLPLKEVDTAIASIKARVPAGTAWGSNFIAHAHAPQMEDDLADLLLRHGVNLIEASAFMEVTPSLVRYRARGLRRDGRVVHAGNRIVAKVSRPDVAAQFLAPAPDRLIERLLASGELNGDEAALLRAVPMADAIVVESDSGGHTDQGMPFTLIPAVLRVRDAAQARFPDFGPLHVGAAGGIGTPEAAAAVFMLGADFIVTGSVNQCSPQAGTSDAVKDLLAGMNVYDTDYAPSGEMFEMGSKVQVLKKGLFFAARANKLVGLYRQHDSLDQIDPTVRRQIEERYFQRSLDQVFDEVRASYRPAEVERAERSPKHRMALVFKRYFRDTTRWALAGDLAHKVDFQVHCGPAMGALNQWVAGSDLADWRSRHVDVLADRLMEQTATLLGRRFIAMGGDGA